MTKREFGMYAFTSSSEVIYKGETYPIAAVDFSDNAFLIGGSSSIEFDSFPDNTKWVSCEDCELVISDS